MTPLRRLATSLLSDASRRKVKKSFQLASYQGQRRPKTPLAREIMRLEWAKSDAPLHELRGFPELQNPSWLGLETIAYQIVRHYRPKVIVELGSHSGLSAFAMGLALRDLGEGGRLFAVDCWEGDRQTGHYDEAVYRTFLRRREELKLESTIVPLKMYFDEARDQVDAPIDLLHIDGLHTLESATHDWETFGPLVRPGGLVMFHDVNTHFADMREFWDGMSKSFESHTIPYSHGLGIIRTKA